MKVRQVRGRLSRCSAKFTARARAAITYPSVRRYVCSCGL